MGQDDQTVANEPNAPSGGRRVVGSIAATAPPVTIQATGTVTSLEDLLRPVLREMPLDRLKRLSEGENILGPEFKGISDVGRTNLAKHYYDMRMAEKRAWPESWKIALAFIAIAIAILGRFFPRP